MSAECLPIEEPRFDFDSVYRDNVGYVWRTLQRLGVRTADLEDRTQDVFAVVYRKQESFDHALPVRPWLFGIAFRVSSAARRLASGREFAQEGLELPDPALRYDELSDKRRLVLSGLEQCSFDQRAVLIMHDLDGHTAPEIADALQIPLNTVYSRLRLGREHFVRAVRTMEKEPFR